MLEIKDKTRLWKLTTAEGLSWHPSQTPLAEDYRWGWGVTREARITYGPPMLCSGTVIHAYRTPYHAVVFDGMHCGLLISILYGNKYSIGIFDPPLLWEAEGEVVVEDGSKVGVRKLTTWNTVDLPDLSTFTTTPDVIRWRVENGADLFDLCGVTKENDAYSLF